MYKNNSNNMQGRASRLTMKDAPSDLKVSLKDELEANKKALDHIQFLQSRQQTQKEKDRLGKERHILQLRQTELKKSLGIFKPKRHREDKIQYLNKAMREFLDDQTFSKIQNRAIEMYDQAEEEKNHV